MLNLESIERRLEEFQKEVGEPHACEMCGFMTPCVCPDWDELMWDDLVIDLLMDEDETI